MISKYLDKVILVILFLILATAPTQYSFNAGNAHISLADPLIWLGGLLFCISAAIRILFSKDPATPFKKRLFAILKEILPLPENILFLVLITFSFFKAENLADAAKELFQLIEYVIVAFVLFSKIRYDENMLAKTAVLFLSLISVVVLVAVFQYFNGSAGAMEVKGTFGNRNTYGGFLAATLPPILSIILLIRKMWVKIWGLLILASGGLTVLSGGAVVGLLLAGSLVCIFVSRRAFLIWASIIAVTVILVFPVLPRNNMEILKQSVSMFDQNGQVEPRYSEWQASLQMWNEQPLLGVGLGNYQSQIGMNYGFLAVKGGPKEHDHNNLFLVFGSSTGILGLIGLLTMLLFWFQRTTIAFFCCKSGFPNILKIERSSKIKEGGHSCPPTRGLENPRSVKEETHQNYNETFSNVSLTGYQKILALGAMGAIVAFCITSIWTALLVRGVFLLFVIIIAVAISSGRQQTES
jgi:O-antigen ligase